MKENTCQWLGSQLSPPQLLPRPSHKQNKTNKKESEKGGENKDLLRAFERSCHSLADIFMLV